MKAVIPYAEGVVNDLITAASASRQIALSMREQAMMPPYTAVDLIRVVQSEIGQSHKESEQFHAANGYPRPDGGEERQSRWQRIRSLVDVRHPSQDSSAGGRA